jgi:hypothetical protein
MVLFRESTPTSHLLLQLFETHFGFMSSQSLDQKEVRLDLPIPFRRVLRPIDLSFGRKINSPYRGTLSSYGYVLLVIYFLVHVKNPPVLPNLQAMPPLRPIAHVGILTSPSQQIIHPVIGRKRLYSY